MKLDRNINPSGMGKYILIRTRQLGMLMDQEKQAEVKYAINVLEKNNMIAPYQFFVLGYRDMFTPAALCAYRDAVIGQATKKEDEAKRLLKFNPEAKDTTTERMTKASCLLAECANLYEFADEISKEVEMLLAPTEPGENGPRLKLPD